MDRKRSPPRTGRSIDLSRRDKLLLEQFKEGAQQCRWYENLTRVSWGIYFPAATILGGYMLSADLANWKKAILAAVGTIISFATVLILYRLRIWYSVYMDILKDTESKLGLDIYKNAESNFGPSFRQNMPSCLRQLNDHLLPLTNKKLPGYLILMFAISFLAASIYYAICALRF
jgi:hypothetical protein